MFVMFCLLLYCLYSVLFFFFKQKTAYEMRISDWSSDVCSSDLDSGFVKAGNTASTNPESRIPNPGFIESTVGSSGRRRAGAGNTSDFPLAILPRTGVAGSAWAADARPADAPKGRSEEHTSELQSLMRISYAVFCLKKKKIKHT